MESSDPTSARFEKGSLHQRLLESGRADLLRAAYDGLRGTVGHGGKEHGRSFDSNELGWQVAAVHEWAIEADVLEKNEMHCDDGEIVPFDVIPIRCEGIFLEMMHAAAERML